MAAAARAAPTSSPRTPIGISSLSRELEEVIAQKNLLTCRSRRKLLTELEQSAQDGENKEMNSLRQRAIGELLQSEKSYLRHLEIVATYFMEPLRERRDWLSLQDHLTIFGDLPSILQVNRELLLSLETSTDQIGSVFLELAPYLKFYSTYAQDFQAAAGLVEKFSEKHKGFRTWLSNQESRPEVQLKLNALLITPVQRIPRYKMLLEDVIKSTPECHPDKTHLRRALTEIDAVAWHINDQLKEHENGLKVLDIQRSLQGYWPKIVAPGRKLIRQGNLMKVPRTGGSAQPRYFVLFSDMLMYCKIKIAGAGRLVLPKANSLECGCMMPLKHTKVEALVGKGVFKVTCQKEELILYSADGCSEEWVDGILKAIEQRKKDAATLRKESTRREPLKRPQILKMRRESLSQIMLNNNKHKMTLRERKDSPSGRLTPRKKRIAPDTPTKTPTNSGASPSKIKKVEAMIVGTPKSSRKENITPKRSTRSSARKDDLNDKRAMPAPTQTPTSSLFVSSGSVSLRKKKVSRPTWKTLSLSRKNKLKEEESGPAAGDLFKSPSIYGNRDNIGGGEAPSVMSSYLSGKICPLTPSQQQTDISHLVQRELKEKLKSPDYPQQQQRQTFRDDEDDDDEYNTNKQNALVPANVFQSHSKSDGGGGICTVM